jgi:hypothetical protein
MFALIWTITGCVLLFAASFSWWAPMLAILVLQPALAGFLRAIEKPAKAGSE